MAQYKATIEWTVFLGVSFHHAYPGDIDEAEEHGERTRSKTVTVEADNATQAREQIEATYPGTKIIEGPDLVGEA